ncbi:MAG: endolytic transglycosylase MltG [Bacteroidota bacterium]
MNTKKKISIAILIIGIVGIIVLWPKISLYLAGSKTTSNEKSVEFYFDAKNDLNGLAEQLISEKIIENKDAFMKVGEYKNLNKERLASGKYIIEKGTNYRTLLNGFTKNSNGNGNAEVEVEVTFNNCRDVVQLAGKVSKCIMTDSTELASFLTSETTLQKYDFTSEQLPALFLPNTYKMFWDTDAEQFLVRMAKEFKNFWTDERKAKLAKIGLNSPSEAVTLASVVYSEQGKNPSEWPIIAGLYLNRIEKGMKLQSDPTFKFCWGDELAGVQRLTFEHRDRDCAYNTYLYKGLPPGPICIPPTQCVDAVLNRDDNDYIFMMAKADYSGLHDFTVDYADHDRLAKIYSKWLKSEGY